jgi:hypothetical protein
MDISQSLPRYVVMQHRPEKARVFALVTSRKIAQSIVVETITRNDLGDEFFVVLDAAESDEDTQKIVGACCHTSQEIVLLDDERGPRLMPVEIARVYEGEEGVEFLTDNRKGGSEA